MKPVQQNTASKKKAGKRLRVTTNSKVAGQSSVRHLEKGATITHRGGAYNASKILGYRSSNPSFIIDIIEEGIGTDRYNRLASKMGLSLNGLADALNINRRTLSRRKKEGKISSDESDRLYRLTEIFAEAIKLFNGNEEAASQWFKKENLALGDETPLSFSRTHIGAKEVSALIQRLEHNVIV